MMLQYGKNIYTCLTCGFQFVTIDRDSGTTPFVTKCRAPDRDCPGAAQSAFYRVPQNAPELMPSFEWYRPMTDLDKLSPNAAEHVRLGGLLLRPIGEAPEAIELVRLQSLPHPFEKHLSAGKD